jgi:hypothetical protein
MKGLALHGSTGGYAVEQDSCGAAHSKSAAAQKEGGSTGHVMCCKSAKQVHIAAVMRLALSGSSSRSCVMDAPYTQLPRRSGLPF